MAKKNKKSGPKNHVVAITGGVLSGLGKGVLTSSLATLLEAQGDKVTAMKCDPYLNFDAGTMNPKEHGEVYVTEDGFETDQDLGNYERFTNTIETRRANSVTNGQVLSSIIDRERKGGYHGKCVEHQHIVEEAMLRIKQVQEETKADYTLVELGGTVGEDLHGWFLDALRLMKFEGESISYLHMGFIPQPKIGEQKTKPMQESVKKLLGKGILADFVVGRAERPLDEERVKKIARNCSIPPEHIISAFDEGNIYRIPLNLEDQELDIKLLETLGERYKRTRRLKPWVDLVENIENIPESNNLEIGLVGKYQNTGNFTLYDTYISVIQSLKIAGWHKGYNIDIKWINSEDFDENKRKLKSKIGNLHGVVVPGGFGERGIEGKINAIEYSRKHSIPFLGLCYGLQLAVVEYARNVLKLKGANTTEVDEKAEHPVIHMLPEQAELLENGDFGGSMRLGAYDAELSPGTLVHKLYSEARISERHRHRLEVNKDYVDILKQKGLIISGINSQRNLVEFIELPEEKHPYFVATQAHPEFKSRFMKPSPLFSGLINAAIDRKYGH